MAAILSWPQCVNWRGPWNCIHHIHDNGRTLVRLWIHLGYPFPHPTRWAMGSLSWLFCRKLAVWLWRHSVPQNPNTDHYFVTSLQWRHNEHDGVSNHQPNNCLLNRLFRCSSKKTSKLCFTGLFVWNLPMTGEFPAQRASKAEDVSIWWHHHVPPQTAPFSYLPFYNWLSNVARDHFHHIPNSLKYLFCPHPDFVKLWTLWNVVNDMRAMLLWHVQNFVVILCSQME